MSLIIPQVIKKVNDLFIDTRYTHLLQKNNGEYHTSNVKENSKNKKKYGTAFKRATYLADWKIQSHLEGKSTIGVFGQSMHSKFLTFDVDFKDDLPTSQSYVFEIIESLNTLGISSNDIHVSFSGSKGYHVDLYFNKPIALNKLNQFFQLTMKHLGLIAVGKGKGTDVYSFKNEKGAVEFRPIGTRLGVKLPLGTHRVTKKKCWYVDIFNKLKPIEDMEYILTIDQMDSDIIEIILEENEDEFVQYKEVVETTEFIKENYKPLPIYKVGIKEEDTVDAYEMLDEEGLKYKGTRFFSTTKLARYYRYLGLTEKETVQALINWMSEQDTRMYDTKIEDCIKEIKRVATYTFENQLTIVQEKEFFTVSYSEMVEILKAKKKNNKLTLFAMLIHSKRYADAKGVFYMTFDQIHKTTGLAEKNARVNVALLESQGLIDVVARNQSQVGTHIKKPNKYMVNIVDTDENAIQMKIGGLLEEQFNNAVVSLIPLETLKKELPRRHYEELRELYTTA